LQDLADGKIAAEGIPVDPKTNKNAIRYAPSFSAGSSVTSAVTHPYTMEFVARVMGKTQEIRETPTNSFVTAFGVVELAKQLSAVMGAEAETGVGGAGDSFVCPRLSKHPGAFVMIICCDWVGS
jgi:hypothetical protein